MPEAGMDIRIEQENAQGVGALLRASRLRCGEDLRDVSGALRIRQSYLEAIENGRCQELPGPAYAIGFVRAYAEHLGLDSAEVVRRFKAESSAANGRSELVFPTPVVEAGIPGGAIVFVGAVVAVLAYGGWYLSTTKDGFFAELIAPLPDRLTALLAAKDESTPVAVLDSAATGAAGDLAGQRSPSSATAASLPDQPAAPTGSASAGKTETTAVMPESLATTPDAPPTPSSDAAPAMATRVTDGPAVSPPADTPAEAPPSAATPAPTPEGTVEPKEPVTATNVDEAPSPAAPSVAAPSVAQDAPSTPVADRPTEAAPTTPPAAPLSTMHAATEFAGLPDTPLPDDSPPATDDAPGSSLTRAATDSGRTDAGPDPRAASEPQPTAARPPAAAATVTTDFDAPSTSARAPQSAPAEPQLASRAEEPRSGSSAPVAAGADSRILVKAKMNAWIQVRDDISNQLLLTRLMKPGDSYAVPDRPGLKLLTGNAGALEIEVDGTVVPSIGPVGAVRRGVALEIDRLRAGTAVSE